MGAEISAASKQQEMKEGQLADLLNKVAESKETIESSNEAIDTDTAFLQNLLKNRKAEDEQYAARSKTRAEEIENLGKVLEILTNDDARNLFGKTMSFVQTGTST